MNMFCTPCSPSISALLLSFFLSVSSSSRSTSIGSGISPDSLLLRADGVRVPPLGECGFGPDRLPSPDQGQATSMSLYRRNPSARTAGQWGDWARLQRESLGRKYGDLDHDVNAEDAGESLTTTTTTERKRKRAEGTNLLGNQNSDSSFFGSFALGTPAISYNVILDTGSSDLWLASSNCTFCGPVPSFDPLNSSSFTPSLSGKPFKISYGSGEASGTLGSDTVQMAGFSVTNQTLAVCDTISDGLLDSPVSGLLGLGWHTIATSRAMPLWETLASAKPSLWNEPVMAFHLTRFVNDSRASKVEPGGSFTMGFTNRSLYTGDIEYTKLAVAPSYWILPLTSLTVRGHSVDLPSDSGSYAAIDTGTTLVGGPPEFVYSLYQQIPNARPGSGKLKGYYTYPCNTVANVTVSFDHGRSWLISEADFRLAQLSEEECLGGIFQLRTSQSAPAWIIGGTFLKNVYSVFRYDPASVGFAELSDAATSMNGMNGPGPTPTMGSVTASVTASQPLSSGEGRLPPFSNSADLPSICYVLGTMIGVHVIMLLIL